MSAPVSPPSGPPRRSRWLRWLLVASLALNLLVMGVMAGNLLRHAAPTGQVVPVARNLGFGPWAAGLTREDSRALRKAYMASGMDFRAIVAADRADRAALIAALRAEPFVPAALDTIAARFRDRAIARLDLGEQLIRDHVAALTSTARAELATRIEQHYLDRAAHRRDRSRDRKRADQPAP